MEIVPLEQSGIDAAVRRAAQAIRQGKIIVYPTDTLYGLGVDALNRRAIERLRDLKEREAKKPLSILVPGVHSIEKYGVMNETARDLAERFLPGALTLVLPATRRVPQDITLDGAVGIRVPNDPFSLALARAVNRPITATSANRAGFETPPTIHNIIKQFGMRSGAIELMVDAGVLHNDVASTVVGFDETGKPLIIREGAISRETLGI